MIALDVKFISDKKMLKKKMINDIENVKIGDYVTFYYKLLLL